MCARFLVDLVHCSPRDGALNQQKPSTHALSNLDPLGMCCVATSYNNLINVHGVRLIECLISFFSSSLHLLGSRLLQTKVGTITVTNIGRKESAKA